MTTETESGPHPLCILLRNLRVAAGMSLTDVEEKFGIKGVVLGAYERGDRTPPLPKLEAAFRCYGYTLQAVPTGMESTRLPEDVVGELRAIADQLEDRLVVSSVS